VTVHIFFAPYMCIIKTRGAVLSKIINMLRNRVVRMCRVTYIHSGPTRIVKTPLPYQNNELSIVYNLSVVFFKENL